MKQFLNQPHLPQGSVCLCAIGAGHPYIKEELHAIGLEVIELEPLKNLPAPVQNHADLLIHHMGGERVWAQNTALARQLEPYGVEAALARRPASNQYPGDTALNCFSLGELLFCNEKVIDEILLKKYQSQGKRVISVKQGYTKCSTVLLNSRAIITSDSGIAKKAHKENIDVLLITPGHIRLAGYNYGFIGGCCGLVSKRLLAFYGAVNQHPDYKEIKDFCIKHAVEITSLCGKLPLTDIGGILPLVENWKIPL